MQPRVWSLCFRTFIVRREGSFIEEGSKFLRKCSFVPGGGCYLDGAMSSTPVEGTSQKLAD